MAMESLVIGTLDQIALEGPQGCSLAQLWPLLESSGVVLGLTDPLKQVLWDCLLQRLTDIRVCRNIEASSQTEGLEGRPKNKRQRQSEDSAIVPLTEEEVKQTLRNFHAAEEEGLRVVASDAVRDAVLGLHDASLSTFAISDVQRRALEAIAHARQTGVLRSDLAKQLGMEPKNFHYVSRALEARSLITQQNIIVKGADGVSRISTNILHLPRFKLNVVPGLIKEMEAGTFVVEDEEAELARICSCLAASPANTMLESEVKRVLGFLSKHGHRRWRRFKKKLVDNGRLLEFLGIQNDAYVNFLKLSGPATAAQGSLAVKEDEEEMEMDAEVDLVAELGFDDQVINLVLAAGAEGIARHKLAARMGMTNKRAGKLLLALCERMGIRETDEQQGRMQMKVWRAPEKLLQHHKLTHAPTVPAGSWRAAVAAAASARPEFADPDSAVADQPESITADQPEPITATAVPGMLTSVPVAHAVPVKSGDASGEAVAPAPFEFPELPSEPDQAEAPSARSGNDGAGPLLLPPLPVGGSDAPGNQEAASGNPEAANRLNMPAAAPGAALDSNGMPAIKHEGPPPLVQCGTIQIMGASGEANPEQKLSTLTLQRQQRLADIVKRDKFILVSDIPSFFQEAELGTGMGLCDQRTRSRIIDRCLAAGQVLRLLVNLPGRCTKHKGFRVEVLARVGTPLDFTFLNEVRDSAYRRRAERHQRGNVSARAARLQAEGVELPVMDGDGRKEPAVRPGARGTANLKQWNEQMEGLTSNGYLRSRMVRVRLLHYFICRLVGLGGNERSNADLINGNGLPNPALESASRDKEADLNLALQSQLIQIKELANLRAGQAAASTSTAEETTVREGRRLTLKGLWDAMPVEFYFQVVGSGIDREEAEKLCAEDKRMGDLEESVRAKMSSEASCNRLRESLNTMRRIGLLEKEERPDQAGHVQGPASDGVVYVAQPSASLELPANMSQEGGAPSGTVQPGGLTIMHEYDLTQKAKLDEYWARLEYASLSDPVAMRYCWPAKRATEVVSQQGWQILRLMSLQQHRQLRARLAAQVSAGLDWLACQRIAADLKLSYTQVMKIAAQFRNKESLERLRTGAQPLPSLIQPKKKGRPQSLRTEPVQPQAEKPLPGGRKRVTAEEAKEKRAGQARRLRERHAREIELKLQQRAAAGLAESFMDEDIEEAATRLGQPHRPHKIYTTYEEDRTLVCAFVRWHAVHGIGPEKQCFKSSRRLLPDYHLLETQASRRITRLMGHPKTKEPMEKLLALAGQVHARATERAAAVEQAALQLVQAVQQSAAVPAADANGHAGTSADATGDVEASGATEVPAEEAPAEGAPANPPGTKGKAVQKGIKRKPRRLDPDKLLEKGAAVGEIVRRLADGTAFLAVGPDDVEAAHAPPRKRRRPAAAQSKAKPAAEIKGPAGEVEGGASGAEDADGRAGTGKRGGERIEKLYIKRMAAIGEAMQEGPLFKVVTPEDAAALKAAEELVEVVLAAALTDKKMSLRPPCRHVRPPAFRDGAPSLPREKKAGTKRKKASAADTAGAGAKRPKQRRRRSAAAAPQRPSGGDARVDAAALQVTAAFLKGRTLVQQWRSAVGRSALNKHLAMPAGSKPPSTSIAVAMELIRSLLLVAEASPQETPTPDAATALVRRFSQAEITEAFGYLRKAGHVNHGASNRPFHLSDAFKERMQVADFPPEIFVETAAARERLRAAQLLQPPTQLLEQTPEAAALEFAADEELPSGMVAESLSLLAAGALDLRPHNVMVESADAPAEEADPMIGPLTWRIPLRISRGPPTQSAPHTPFQPPPPVSLAVQQGLTPHLQQAPQQAATQQQQQPSRSGDEDRRDAFSAQRQQERQFWPDAVGSNWIVRTAAEAACMEDWTAKKEEPSAEKALLNDALRLMREAGPDGLTLEQLSSSVAVSADKTRKLLEAALCFGLVQRVGGYQAWAYVAAEHCQRFRPDASRQPAEAAAARPPAENSPWTDHRGRLNEPFLRSLTQRAVSVVIRHPGIPEELLVGELDALSPHSARRLLGLLLQDGLISVRQVEAAPAPQPPAIFRRLRQQLHPEPKIVKHYFPNLSCCFGRTVKCPFQQITRVDNHGF
ncbi:hypothetical protein WJX75_000584 [Coccomyxa subellipsoidea]|uniref:B-block binding subunit of TFIIIC domain-containing protein n=1 Tax=Coccomyxa subellipsoidea TaxID=248742 RepID=A0ABR2YUS2_9CHLO